MDNLSSYCASEGYRTKGHPSSSDKKQKADYAVVTSMSPGVLCSCSYQGRRRKRQDGFDEELL